MSGRRGRGRGRGRQAPPHPVPPPPQPGSPSTRMTRLEQIVEQMSATLTQFMAAFANFANKPQAPPPPPEPQPAHHDPPPRAPQVPEPSPVAPQPQEVQQPVQDLVDRNVTRLKQFQKMNPPTFKGVKDPAVAEEWVMKLEKMFKYIGCSGTERVALATYMLESEADHWWTSMEQILLTKHTEITWELFLEAFNEQYILECAQRKKQADFLSLVQGNMTVDQYESRFTTLCRYEPDVAKNELKKTLKFINGLRPAIRSQLAPLNIRTYADAIQRAQLVEQDMELNQAEFQSRLRSRGKRYDDKRSFQNRGQNKRPRVGASRALTITPRVPPTQNAPATHYSHPCRRCGRRHPASQPCQRNSGACYHCGEMGHWMRECPKMRTTPAQPVRTIPSPPTPPAT